jgi:hypothetical protein
MMGWSYPMGWSYTTDNTVGAFPGASYRASSTPLSVFYRPLTGSLGASPGVFYRPLTGSPGAIYRPLTASLGANSQQLPGDFKSPGLVL